MKRPTSDVTQDSIKPSLSNAVELYTKKQREAHKCIQERDEYINYLESKLSNAKPQQALPEWLDIEIKNFKSTSKHSTVDVVFGVADAIVAIKNRDTNSKLYDYLFCGGQDVCNQHQATFALAFITGKYEVEKPQLFYLCEKNTGYYLHKTGNNSYSITAHYSNDSNEKYMHYKFTQQEIDSMQTGSYEQIKVEEEK